MKRVSNAYMQSLISTESCGCLGDVAVPCAFCTKPWAELGAGACAGACAFFLHIAHTFNARGTTFPEPQAECDANKMFASQCLLHKPAEVYQLHFCFGSCFAIFIVLRTSDAGRLQCEVASFGDAIIHFALYR